MKSADEFLSDIEGFRTPEEMEVYFEEKKREIHLDDDYYQLSLLKKGLFKELLEEFYPMYCFSRSRFFENNSKVKIVIGNQGYDGLILKQDGTQQKFELTTYVNGKWEFEDAKRLIKNGLGDTRFGDGKSLKYRSKEYLKQVTESFKKKSLKNYSGVNLLFIVNTFWYFEVYDNSSKSFIDELINEIKLLTFKAEGIYLMVLNNQDVSQIDNNIYDLSNV
ncbi:hypothetical protein JYA63_03400 [Fictibacillus nanhaiensis]|uniref:Uncharacterized protein n=1 Tax=Fictibacillus nanhaiensis TaxID=742169 RepID=A0ABS2ZMA1_9BACL|nr:hypothetical protein [Fictibacillus nanhaiensis]